MQQLQAKRKADGQTINRLQNEIHRLKAQGNTSEGDCAGCATFTQQMLHPESVSPVRWPDCFSEPTSIYKAINNFDLPILNYTNLNYVGTNLYLTDDGRFYCEVHPELSDTILYDDYLDSATVEVVEGGISENTNHYGLFDTNRDHLRNERELTLRASDGWAEVACPLYSSNGVLQPLEWDDSDPGFWMPSTPGLTITFVVSRLNFVDEASISVEYEYRTPSGPQVTEVSISIPGGLDQGPTAVSHVQTFTVPAQSYRNFKIRIRNTTETGTGADLLFSHIYVQYTTDFAVRRAEPLQNVETLERDLEKFRIVSQSGLLTYMGNVLTMAGQISSVLYRGGMPAGYAGISDYTSVAEHPRSFNGTLIDGSYGYFEPQDHVDMSFRTVMGIIDFRRPYLIYSGIFSDLAGVTNGQIRARIVTIVEFTSTAQIFGTLNGPVHPDWIVACMTLLAEIPNVMENGKHLDRLNAYLKKLPGAVKKIATFLYSNRKEIAAAGRILAPIATSAIALI